MKPRLSANGKNIPGIIPEPLRTIARVRVRLTIDLDGLQLSRSGPLSAVRAQPDHGAYLEDVIDELLEALIQTHKTLRSRPPS